MSSNLSDGPACDGKKFFIEVTGINHSPDLTFQFYDQADQIQQEYIEAKQAVQQVLDITIFSWDWTPETEQRNVWLNIAGDNGPIKLPLYTEVSEVPRQPKEQHYQLQAVLPMTLLPSYENSSPEQRQAPIRKGYIYIIHNQKIWREIAAAPNGNIMEFRDIHLYAHRQARHQPFNKGLREPSGAPLKDIWLPTKANNRTLHVRVAYSEVQWSAAYMNFLEQEANWSLLAQRSHTVNPQLLTQLGEQLQKGDIPPMRLREPELEYMLAEPTSHNRDLSGNYRQQLFSDMDRQISAMRHNGQSALDAVKFDTPLRLEYGARTSALNQQINGANEEQRLWQAISGSDYLSEARERKLRLLQLPDPIFELRHHTAMASQVSASLFHVLEDAGQQKYFQSAELVQRFVVPAKLPNDQDNPNHKHLDSFDNSPIGVFQRSLRGIERRRCHEDMAQLQQALGRVFDSPATAAAVRDITSLDRGAVGAYPLVGNAMQTLSLNLAAIDPLQDKQQPQNWPGRSTIAGFYKKGASHPLHALLYPQADQVPLDQPYTPPAALNDGSGLASCENIAGWAGETLLLNDQIESLDHALLTDNIEIQEQASLLAENSEDTFAASRRMLNTADGILSGFYTAMLALQNKASARTSLSGMLETIEFKAAYLDNIRLAKLIDPKTLGQITYIPTSGEPIAGAYVLGIHSSKAGLHYGLSEGQRQQVHKKRTGVFKDKNGRLLASTNKRSLKGSELRQGASVKSKADLRALVVPDNNPLTQLKAQQLAKQADLTDQLKPQSQGKSTAGKAYQGLGVPYFIVVLEIINLQRTMAGLKEKSIGYSVTSSVSAFIDLGVAIISAANFLTKEAGRIAALSTSSFLKAPPSVVKFMSFPAFKLHFESSISRLKFAGIFGGALTTAVAIWDTSILISEQDNDAAVAMAMVALGTGLSTFGSLYTATFMLSPLGWIGLVIALVGFGLYMLFKDSPMETWLKNGPFGNTPDRTGDYKDLQQPKSTWQQLISLILNIQINTYPLTEIDIDPALKANLQNRGATHGVWITSNLPSLIKSQHHELRFFAREALKKTTSTSSRTTVYSGPEKEAALEKIARHNSQPIYKLNTDNGTLFFYKYASTVPGKSYNGPWDTFLSGDAESYNYNAHFHCRAQYEIGEHRFPSPPPGESKQAGNPTDTPTFKANELWWATEAIKP